jgi:hypothetical protein
LFADAASLCAAPKATVRNNVANKAQINVRNALIGMFFISTPISFANDVYLFRGATPLIYIKNISNLFVLSTLQPLTAEF